MKSQKPISVPNVLIIFIVGCSILFFMLTGCKPCEKIQTDDDNIIKEEENTNVVIKDADTIYKVLEIEQTDTVYRRKTIEVDKIDTIYRIAIIEIEKSEQATQGQELEPNNSEKVTQGSQGSSQGSSKTNNDQGENSLWGRIAYFCPEEMREEQTYDVIAVLSRKEVDLLVQQAITSIIEEDKGQAAATAAKPFIYTEPAIVSDLMVVELLHDPDKIRITRIHTNDTLSLKGDEIPEWRWKVKPLEGSGADSTELTFRVTVAGQTPITQSFTVKVLLKDTLFSSFKKEVVQDPKWLVSTIVIPLLTFIAGMWRGRRKKKTEVV